MNDENFWMLDYLVNAISVDKNYDAYHVFKNMSLIEMLIIKPNKGKCEGEMEAKLPLFMKSDSLDPSLKIKFSQITRKLRNKIGHGDFIGVHKLLDQYKNIIIPEYNYDEIEYSVENWNYLSICCKLDEILSEIIWILLTDKEELLKIQYS